MKEYDRSGRHRFCTRTNKQFSRSISQHSGHIQNKFIFISTASTRFRFIRKTFTEVDDFVVARNSVRVSMLRNHTASPISEINFIRNRKTITNFINKYKLANKLVTPAACDCDMRVFYMCTIRR